MSDHDGHHHDADRHEGAPNGRSYGEGRDRPHGAGWRGQAGGYLGTGHAGPRTSLSHGGWSRAQEDKRH